VGAVLMSFLIPGVVLYTSPGASALFLCLLIYSLGLFLTSIHSIWNEHIVVSENEITYKRLGLEYKVFWKSFDLIGVYLFQEGLFVDKAQIKIKTWFTGGIETYMGYGQKVFIPVSLFSDNWRESELGQQIKQYAPHLFQ
jgi:hypothetical protein